MSQQYYSSQQQQARPGRHAHHAITGAANAAGLIRITAPAHTFSTGNVVDIGGVLGTVEANKTGWTVTVIDVNTFDLQGSTFTNAYVSGGTASLQ